MTRDADTIRAFVDGELDDLAAARIASEAQVDPELATIIAAERSLRDKLSVHFGAVLADPVPERLSAPIDAARKVISLGAARERRSIFNIRTLRWAGPAMAATLVLAIAVPALRQGGPTETRDGAIFAANELAQALDTQLVADQRKGSETRILLSFAERNGTLCRGFARTDISGIACRGNDGWQLRLMRGGIDTSESAYRQAGSPSAAIMEAAQDMASGPALDPAQEREAKARGWRAE